jgi:catechol 2,3-dioxygenase-like lactoylglutathione lyase family enzyme
MTCKFDHVHLRCQDLETAVNYYVNLFGGKILNGTEVRGLPIVQIEVGGQRLFLSPKLPQLEVEPNSGKARWGVYQLAFAVENMDAAVKELKAKGAQFEGEPIVVNPSVTIAFIKGPDGVQIELLQRS